MLIQLQNFNQQELFTIDVIDVDADEELVAQYDELVPVLIAKKEGEDPVQLCHYFLDVPKLKSFLGLST